MKRHVLPLAALALATPLALGACGGDDDDGGGSASPTSAAGGGGNGLTVEARDIAFDKGAYTAPAGEVRVTYADKGTLPHTLLIEGVDGFKLGVNGAAPKSEGTVTLQPGEYTIFCDIPGHRASMEATLTVE